jgi:hypothetical protein
VSARQGAYIELAREAIDRADGWLDAVESARGRQFPGARPALRSGLLACALAEADVDLLETISTAAAIISTM